MEENKQLAVFEINGKPAMSSVKVAALVEKEHKNLLRDIRNYIDILDSSDLSSGDFFKEHTYLNDQNKELPCYMITRQGCEMIANKMNGKKGVIFTAKYVKRFEAMEQQILANNKDSYMIDDPIARAKKWIEEETERLQLKIVAEEQQKEIAALAPKAAFADAVSASSDTILLRELAKLIKQNGFAVGEQRLKEKLRQYGYLIKNDLAPDYNLPTQKSMELGLFKVKQTTITSSSGSVHITNTVRVTPKGVQYIMNKFLTGKIVV
jgi:Rha family phage regulatory protein